MGAPAVGFEPTTLRLTVECSAVELCGIDLDDCSRIGAGLASRNPLTTGHYDEGYAPTPDPVVDADASSPGPPLPDRRGRHSSGASRGGGWRRGDRTARLRRSARGARGVASCQVMRTCVVDSSGPSRGATAQ